MQQSDATFLQSLAKFQSCAFPIYALEETLRRYRLFLHAWNLDGHIFINFLACPASKNIVDKLHG
jgi:hypothetical protein